jgi:hypothetical protein
VTRLNSSVALGEKFLSAVQIHTKEPMTTLMRLGTQRSKIHEDKVDERERRERSHRDNTYGGSPSLVSYKIFVSRHRWRCALRRELGMDHYPDGIDSVC